MTGNITDGIFNNIPHSHKIASVQHVKCKFDERYTDGVEAIMIIFDDGQTLVSCPSDRSNHICHYEIKPRSVPLYYHPWFIFSVLILLVVAALIIFLIINGYIKI